MIISSFWANDLSDILGFLLTSGATIIFSIAFLVIGYVGLSTFCLDFVKESNNKYLNYTLFFVSFLMLLGMIKLSIWGYECGYENYTPRWMHTVVSRYDPRSASNAGWSFVMVIGSISIAISITLHSLRYKIRKSAISRTVLREYPYLKLNEKGIYSIARIIEIEDISLNSCWITYEFTWRDTQYRNRVARSKTKRNGAFDIYEVGALLFVHFVKNDPSNNLLTDNQIPVLLAIKNVPKNGWTRKEYIYFTEH